MIFFFYGPNTFASRREVRKITEAYIKKTGGDLGLERIDGAETNIKTLTSVLQASPFLTTSRLVIVEQLSQNKAVAEAAVKLIDQVPATTVAIFYEQQPDQRTVYFKAFSKLKNAIKFELLSPHKLVQWVKSETQSQGGSIDNQTVTLLLELAGEDQWRLEQEITKLVNYNAEITVVAVKELVVASPSEDIFALVEAVAAGKPGQALKVYSDLIRQQVNEIYILSMIIWQLRNLLLAKTAGNRTPAQLASEVKMSPYVASKAMARRGQFSEQQLKTAFLEAVETDYLIKSGQGEPGQLLEALIYRLTKTAR